MIVYIVTENYFDGAIDHTIIKAVFSKLEEAEKKKSLWMKPTLYKKFPDFEIDEFEVRESS